MRSKNWIILGFIGIIIGIVVPMIIGVAVMNDIQSAGPFSGHTNQPSGDIQQSIRYAMIFGAISQIFFCGGIVSAAFGLVKFYKEKD
jgi:hypothetical protein